MSELKNVPNWELDYIDYPTAWHILSLGNVEHTSPRCSYVQTGGGMICDCGAVETEWRRLCGLGGPNATTQHNALVDL